MTNRGSSYVRLSVLVSYFMGGACLGSALASLLDRHWLNAVSIFAFATVGFLSSKLHQRQYYAGLLRGHSECLALLIESNLRGLTLNDALNAESERTAVLIREGQRDGDSGRHG